MAFTSDDVVTIFNSVGFTDTNEAIAALATAKLLFNGGITQQFVTRLQLLNKRTVLEQQRTEKQVAQQLAQSQAAQPFNNDIDSINQQLAQVEQELSQMPVF